MTEPETITDVVELCALLECLGFSVKSLDASNTNHSQDEGTAAAKTLVINCQFSGIHVVLESAASSCSCPVSDPQNSGFWQVSGVSGGKQLDKEFGSTLLRALPKPYRERFSKQLYDMIRCIRALNTLEDSVKSLNKSSSMVDLVSKSASLVDVANKSASLAELSKDGHKSASIIETGTPDKRHFHMKVETPTRYRSLDTLTKDGQPQLNPPIGDNPDLKKSIHRQSTYTVCSTCSTPGSVRMRNKTSSPIHTQSSNFLESLIESERVAETLRNKLSAVIREYMDNGKDDSSITSMLDVSKISLLKGADGKSQFASSPNLSGISCIREEYPKSKLKRFESASTSNLAKPEGIKSKLRRISPNMFRMNKDKDITKDKGEAIGRSKLQSLFRPKIATPVRPQTRTPNSEPSPKFNSASKKKFSHVKSTIPRPTPVSTPKKE